jgi:predicted PurR-regulated permease PerM
MAVSLFSDPRFWAWAAIALAAVALLYALSPILAPFLFAAIFAYILDPLVERLTGRRVRRTFAVVLVLTAAIVLLGALALVVGPLFYKELRMLADRLPAFLFWMNEQFAPWLKENFGLEFRLDVQTVRQFMAEIVSGDVAAQLLASLKVGGLALVAFLVNLLLVPVVLFYLLRDWHALIERAERLIPRAMLGKTLQIFREVDAVLAEFLRGQLLVIVVMTLFYVTALWAARLEFALPIGIITGLLVFIPYVGAITGLVLGTIAALMQFGTLAGVAWVWLAFALGQALEGMLVTPLLVGERIGLHPVAVIFALLAFGHLFGFFGVLLALPASAALLVALRHLRAAYLASPLYGDSR